MNNTLRIIWSIAFFASFATNGRAAEPDDKSVVLVLAFSEGGEDEDLEGKFVVQLALALDQFSVQKVLAGLDGFIEKSLPKRLETIERLTVKHTPVATIWLEQTETGLTLLNLVSLSTGQALVRIVEAPSSSDTAIRLALVAQELLGQSYMLDESLRNEAIETVVVDLAKKTVSSLEDPSEVVASAMEKPPSMPAVSMTMSGEVRGGIYGQENAPVLLGGGLSVEIWVLPELFILASISALAGIRQEESWGTLSPFILQPTIGAGYLWRHSWLQIGPVVQFSGVWNRVTVNSETTGNSIQTWWSFRASLQASLRALLSKNTYLALSPGVGLMQANSRFYLSPEDETVYQSSRVDWNVALSLGFFF